MSQLSPLSPFSASGHSPACAETAGDPLVVPPAQESGSLSVDGRHVHYDVRGDPASPAVVLVHGARAHRGWWHAVLAAGLADSLRVVTLDLAGHGLSEPHEDYSPAGWARQVAEVVRQVAGGRCVVVGHSMGGLVTYATAALHPDRVSRVVTFDSKVRIPTPHGGAKVRGIPGKPLRPYATRDDILDAFRLLPPQPWINPAAVRHVAEMGIVERDGAWRWRFDPAIAQRFCDDEVARHLRDLSCPVDFFHGAESTLVSHETVRDADVMVGGLSTSAAIPGGHHHLVLDQPELVRDAVIGAVERDRASQRRAGA
ncbi:MULTISPECIES: alpha/beta fold hydrolase [Nocardiaceae]|uniref:Pimeloyl-ACP methyl ester carboxylesterase n=1 Tax=Rhodococcoides corynebacterioides TaxID=53972 RepID=A0ABS2KZU0_9NOCA|nr:MULTISPECIES: alpha/beta hydrolase [Rhodococcus]MBM7417465.1 pimeloyl-ACP methyl ester carboxylesterase [Rhodococcus corynebacterioides]MBP1115719.1 pimeloyl-ACP methyl ester carboxylesterase [Rhodococcus sp. PvP016]